MKTERKEKYTPEELRTLFGTYTNKEADIMEDTDEILEVYAAVNTLNEADKIILYLYAELGSLRAVGRTLGVSYSTARKAVQEIKNKIYEILENGQ